MGLSEKGLGTGVGGAVGKWLGALGIGLGALGVKVGARVGPEVGASEGKGDGNEGDDDGRCVGFDVTVGDGEGRLKVRNGDVDGVINGDEDSGRQPSWYI